MKVLITVVLELPQSSIYLTPIEVATALQRTLNQADFQLQNELRAIGATFGHSSEYKVRVTAAAEMPPE